MLNCPLIVVWHLFRDLRPPSNLRRDRNHLGRKFAFYSIYAWGVPLFIVVFGQILEQLPNLPRNIVKPDFGRFKCWFTGTSISNLSTCSDRNFDLLYLKAWKLCIFFIIWKQTKKLNCIFFTDPYLWWFLAILFSSSWRPLCFTGPVSIPLWPQKLSTPSKSMNYLIDFFILVIIKKKCLSFCYLWEYRFRVIGSLFILMGVPWLMEVISFAVGGSRFIWMATDILNIFTGVFMFVITVCKSKVWKLIKAKFSFLERFSWRIRYELMINPIRLLKPIYGYGDGRRI